MICVFRVLSFFCIILLLTTLTLAVCYSWSYFPTVVDKSRGHERIGFHPNPCRHPPRPSSNATGSHRPRCWRAGGGPRRLRPPAGPRAGRGAMDGAQEMASHRRGCRLAATGGGSVMPWVACVQRRTFDATASSRRAPSPPPICLLSDRAKSAAVEGVHSIFFAPREQVSPCFLYPACPNHVVVVLDKLSFVLVVVKGFRVPSLSRCLLSSPLFLCEE